MLGLLTPRKKYFYFQQQNLIFRTNDINSFNKFGQSFLTEWSNNPANARLVARTLERSLALDDRNRQQVLQEQRLKLRENPYYRSYQIASNSNSNTINLPPEFYQQPQNNYERPQKNYRQQQNFPQSNARYVIT